MIKMVVTNTVHQVQCTSYQVYFVKRPFPPNPFLLEGTFPKTFFFRTIQTATSRSQRSWSWLMWAMWLEKQSGVWYFAMYLLSGIWYFAMYLQSGIWYFAMYLQLTGYHRIFKSICNQVFWCVFYHILHCMYLIMYLQSDIAMHLQFDIFHMVVWALWQCLKVLPFP